MLWEVKLTDVLQSLDLLKGIHVWGAEKIVFQTTKSLENKKSLLHGMGSQIPFATFVIVFLL